MYEYTVSGFLRNACVPMLMLLCALYVMLAFGGGGERPIERQIRRLAVVSEEESGGGGAARALMLGHRRREPAVSSRRILPNRRILNGVYFTLQRSVYRTFTFH
jgi:hypothetical protein